MAGKYSFTLNSTEDQGGRERTMRKKLFELCKQIRFIASKESEYEHTSCSREIAAKHAGKEEGLLLAKSMLLDILTPWED